MLAVQNACCAEMFSQYTFDPSHMETACLCCFVYYFLRIFNQNSSEYWCN